VSWLKGPGGADLDWDGVTGLFPAAADSVTRLHRVIWEQCDPVLDTRTFLHLCPLAG
jgi:hypothetical protein